MRVVLFSLFLSMFLRAAVHHIDIVNFAFVPQNESVTPGDTVRWVNQSMSLHTSTSGVNGVPDSIWNSGTIAPGDSFDFVFNLTPAIYHYYCAFHWQGGMTGSILVATGVEETGHTIPIAADLLRVQPDPFSYTTSVYFEIAEPSMNDISIYSSTGQAVRSLLRGFMAAGKHAISWDARDDSGRRLPPGLYFMVFYAGSYISVQKILLID